MKKGRKREKDQSKRNGFVLSRLQVGRGAAVYNSLWNGCRPSL